MIVNGGVLQIASSHVLSVLGDFTANSGTISFVTGGAAKEVIDVEGSVYITGTTVTAGTTSSGSVFRCRGNWTSHHLFQMADGCVELDNPTGQGILENEPDSDAFRTDLAEEAVKQLEDDGFDVNGNDWTRRTVTLNPNGD